MTQYINKTGKYPQFLTSSLRMQRTQEQDPRGFSGPVPYHVPRATALPINLTPLLWHGWERTSI